MSAFHKQFGRQLEQTTAMLTKISALEAENKLYRKALKQIRDEIAADKDTTIVKMVARIFHAANSALEGQE